MGELPANLNIRGHAMPHAPSVGANVPYCRQYVRFEVDDRIGLFATVESESQPSFVAFDGRAQVKALWT